MNQFFIKMQAAFDKKTILIAKIGVITFFTVFGGHKLVQFVSPTEEELLQVFLEFHFFTLFNFVSVFQKKGEIII